MIGEFFVSISIFVAVMVQFEHEGKIVVLNLACRAVHEAHTGVNIKKWTREVLASYGIQDNSILALTADAAANIQKGAKLFLKEFHGNKFLVGCEQFQVEPNEEDEEDFEGNDDEEAAEFNSEPSNGSLVDEFGEADETLAERMIPTSYRVPCVVHQVQLAINKWCETEAVSNLLATARALVKRLRTRKLVRLLKAEGYRVALIDQDTRWSSKFRMIERLLLLKVFCSDHANKEMKGEN